MDDREIAEDDTDIHIHERATFEPKKCTNILDNS